MKINPLTAIDFYKTDHIRQYPEGTTEVYSNFTPRSAKLAKLCKYTKEPEVVFFGLQYFIKSFLIDTWNNEFFNKNKKEVISKYKRRMDNSLGKDSIDVSHIEKLHDLGYLPIKIKAINEGELVPIGVPLLTIVNTLPEFFWLTNYLETIISSYLWKPITSATTALQYKRILNNYAKATGSSLDFINFQAHDFSFRGMSGIDDAAISGSAHLTSFYGTDAVHSIDLIEDYYNANSDSETIGCSVPATEHSVMCMGTKESEIDTFRRLINDLYPKGIVSIVSDTWDFWKVITEYLPELLEDIINRNGKVVIRPDSGDPVKIICGDEKAEKGTPEHKGAVQCLWEIFGGNVNIINNKVYKTVYEKVGLIYGDSITVERAEEILSRLERKGFSSENIVFGVGSYTYQYVTRDTFGFAMKATSGVVNGERRDIFKEPKTDDGTKKSAKGLLRVERKNGRLVCYDSQTEEQEKGGLLETVFCDGKLLKETSLLKIRDLIKKRV